MKKILILYATAGIGHKKAAMAVKKAFDEMAVEGTEVSLIDALDYTNKFFKWIYLKLYLLMVNSLPTLWGFSYYLTDNFYFNLLIARLRRLNNWMNSRRLREYLLVQKPDVIISTHFFASEVIADMKKSGSLKSYLMTVVTDYKLHLWWVSEPTDAYVVASSETVTDLVRNGIQPSKINSLGIPVEPVFSKPIDKKAILQKAGLKPDIFTVLVIGGGFGIGPIEEIVKVIDKISSPIQTIVICGHNEVLEGRLENMKKTSRINIKALGFVDNVYEYMASADMLISKSGGITVSEAMARELPMIVISPIIGQETRNCDFLVKHKAAVRLGRLEELKDVLEKIASVPQAIDEMKEAIRKIKKPAACYDIARLAIDVLNGRNA